MFKRSLCGNSGRNVYNVQSGTILGRRTSCTTGCSAVVRPKSRHKHGYGNCFSPSSDNSSSVSMWWDNEGEALTAIEVNKLKGTSNSNSPQAQALSDTNPASPGGRTIKHQRSGAEPVNVTRYKEELAPLASREPTPSTSGYSPEECPGLPTSTAGSSSTDPAPSTSGNIPTDPTLSTSGNSPTEPAPSTSGSSHTDPAPSTSGSSHTEPTPSTSGSNPTVPAPSTSGKSPEEPVPSTSGYRPRDCAESIPAASGYCPEDHKEAGLSSGYNHRELPLPSTQCYHSDQVSMAASAAYIPGGSLSDKLRLAASKGHTEKVRELVTGGATLEPDREGRTALHYAALNGYGEIVQILADEGADINSQDTLGYTALHRAAAQGHLEVIKVLLCEGCLVNRQDEHGNSPLHEAAWNGYSKTLELLIRQKANVHCINKAGFSALHLAAQNGHNQSARVLLYAGCNPDMRNNYGDTALHTAARYGHAGVTRILVSAKCRISEQNKNGDTALHISAALKRRKLSKLLTDCGINTSLRNKQNETAVDVARRKEHPEIILIITSQPKGSKKQKKGKDKEKSKKDKGSKHAAEGEETEKKGLFFKKKSKTKEKEKVVVETKPKVVDHPSAPSEISSSDFNSHMAPEDLLRGFRQTMVPRKEQGQSHARGTSTRGSRGTHKSQVQGLLTEYAPKQGVQYYKDLAGNVKQGPIGYTPVCNCQPIIKKLEKKMEHDRNNLYDHIDASHKTLTDRIEGVDKRSAQQVYSIDKLTKERLDNERKERENYVRACIRKDRMEMDETCDKKHGTMKSELQGYLDNRFSNFERYYKVRDAVHEHHNRDHWGYSHRDNQPRYHQDDMLNQNYMQYDPEEPPPPGKLYKSKSDESLASSHHSRKHWKLRSNPTRDITDLKLAHFMDKAHRIDHKKRSRSAGVRAKQASVEQLDRYRDSSVPMSAYSGRTPEGQSGSDQHSEYHSYKDYVEQQHQWQARRAPLTAQASHHFKDPAHHAQPNNVERNTHPHHLDSNCGNHRQPSQNEESDPHSRRAIHERPGNGARDNARNTDMPRIRSRSSSSSRLPNGYNSYNGQSGFQPQSGSATLNKHTMANRQSDMRPSVSAYNLNGATTRHVYVQGSNGTTDRQVQGSHSSADRHVHHVNNSQGFSQPQSSSHDNVEQHQRKHQLSQRPHSQYGPSTGEEAPPAPARAGSEPPARAVPPTVHTPTGSAPPPRWNPLHTSSPDTQPLYGTPDTSNSLVSSQNSTPLYPSPSVPTSQRGVKPQSESGSNPDSGYGSRLFGGRQISGPQLPGSNSSSFQSNHEHNSSLATTNSSHTEGGTSPIVQYEREPGTRVNPSQVSSEGSHQPTTNPNPHANMSQPPRYNNVPGIVNRWYESKVKEQTQKVQDNNRMWPPTRSSRANSQSQGTTQAQVHHNQLPNSNQAPRFDHTHDHGVIGKATQV